MIQFRKFKFLYRIKLKFIFFLVICLLYYFGVYTHVFELDFDRAFSSYPLDSNISKCIESLLNNNTRIQCKKLNSFDYKYILNNKLKCSNSELIKLVIIVKSATPNFQRRIAIRNSWGLENRFSDITIKILFSLGLNEQFQPEIEQEYEKYFDIIQSNFIDSYYNNTIKTLNSFKWCAEFCKNGKFFLFVDDDMYVSVKNVLHFIRNPTKYPHYLSENNNYIYDIELPEDAKLFAGNVVVAAPHRHFCSKWYVSLSEYPYHMYPPYINAGAYILSRNVLLKLYYASYFTKRFKFDDVYLGILAKKVEIVPFHCNEFYYYEKSYNKFDFNYTIVSHGYNNPHKLLQIWNEQKSLGNA